MYLNGLGISYKSINTMWTNYLLVAAVLNWLSLNLTSHDIKNNSKLQNHIKSQLEKHVSLPLRFLNITDLHLILEDYREDILPKFTSWNDYVPTPTWDLK